MDIENFLNKLWQLTCCHNFIFDKILNYSRCIKCGKIKRT